MNISLRLWPLLLVVCPAAVRTPAAEKPSLPGGELKIVSPEGNVAGTCPLKYTDV
ncbi:MAG TPA: hypothetical protein PKK06_07035 [Phycisphaerae bacterium]|nr:hypothetical protein [Phycisphaerae bacterium]HNU45106.1 hypothetical protein [Phycisphaerae bacterium]